MSFNVAAKFGGSVGVLHVVRTESDFQFVTNNPPSPPYALIVTPDLFTRSNILPLKDNPNVAGILIVKQNRSQVPSFSPELQCPNPGSNYNQGACSASKPEATWNPFGTGLLHESFPFPMYFIDDQDEIDRLTKCYDEFNAFDLPNQNQRSLCSIEMKQFMSASVNTKVCLRRSQSDYNVSPTKYCDPLSGKNVFATLYPREEVTNQTNQTQPDEKLILITARLDTTSMFDGLGVGAAEFKAAATLMSTAHILTALLPEKEVSDQPNVLFMLFNGESYDYIGSQRFVYDLNLGYFPPVRSKRAPIKADSIQLHIDIGSLDDTSRVNIYHNREFKQVSWAF